MLPWAGGGPDGHGRPGSPGPVPAAPPIVPGGQVIGVDEQLFEHRVHDVPPQAGERGGAGAFSIARAHRSALATNG